MEWFTSIPFVQDIVILFKPALYNMYFALVSIPIGFPFAIILALGKNSRNWFLSSISNAYIYAFRGSPLFIQFFMFYSLSLAMNQTVWKPLGLDGLMLNPLFIGPLVLILNTSAYSAEIFYGALKSVPKGEIEAARSVGMSKWQEFRTAVWPNMMRLAWPGYTNEVVFLFHATALVYFTLPVINDQKDLMNKAGELFEKDYNLFLHFSVAAFYFLIISMVIFFVFNKIYQYLTRHLNTGRRIKINPNYIR
ncbi:ABC transporter permease subunit [Leucothrix mucor]|uniref:ABC transporter permease subunit n=1 Tax=Leucothrix mucor TaxID=45248 RepID=UPI0003B32D9B|nr:ABC transporter permease subunit [Leucothrix mucor]